MATLPKKPADPAQDNLDPAKLEEAGQAAQQLQRLQAGYDQGRDLVNQMLGQAQALHAASDLLRTGAVSKHAQIKQNKLHQRLAGITTPHGAVLKGTWEEYCTLLGRSVDMVDRDIANLQAFGEEALEAMSRAGIGYRDLRQFRKLPADQKTALIEAAKEGDKDTLLELAEDLIAKHTKEKEALTQDLTEAQATIDAKDAVLDDTQKKLTRLQVQTNKKVVAITDWPDALQPLSEQIAAAGRKIATGLSELETCRIRAFEVGGTIPEEDGAERARFEAALAHVAGVAADALNNAARTLAKEQLAFDNTLGNFLPE